MISRLFPLALLGLLSSIALAKDGAAADVVQPQPGKPVVQIALLLDTSNSMDGLIEQAKTQLWKIVNEFAVAKQNGQAPELYVALYQYGTPSLGADNGYVRQILPLTQDLDKVSQELFALKTDGGDEYCGTVIGRAMEQLAWSAAPTDYRAIFIAGNEPFNQGQVDYRESCKAAIARGVIVNTIFCGNETEGLNTNWKDGAALADGSFMTINQNERIVHVDAPQDKEIAELGVKLNETYLAFGVAGEAGAMNQAAQDRNAASQPAAGAPVQRALAKASGLYRNEWDLVDAVKGGKVKLAEIKEEELPDAIKKLPADERQGYIDQQLVEREKIQKRIAELNTERNKFVADEMKNRSDDPANTLDAAIVTTVREQAAKRSFDFEGK